ncbi:HNH endonuclease [Cellulomonas sp. Leaf395]|uniref:HNH endonuclease n=1 Tax=Cellulomonas sp. Leaf395 TaxID=1736362 RepID=UPI0012FCE420|nr:HNH endonuclease [Cellulomonas sp. Leaf395]
MDPPTLDASTVVATCARAIGDLTVATALVSSVDVVQQRTAAFVAAVAGETIHTERGSEYQIPGLTHKQISTVYSKHFVDQASAGRAMYDTIRLSTPWCLACGHQRVNTLDHYLPKSRFPALALTPVNLTPMCQACNQAKSTRIATCAEEVFVHPYYEDYESAIWLLARVVRTPEPHLSFACAASPWSAAQRARIENHITRFKLDRMYRTEAARLIAQSQRMLTRVHVTGGRRAVREVCLERESDLREYRLNDWGAATWAALSHSDWFCDGGFRAFAA